MKNEFDNKTKEYSIGRPTYPNEVLKILSELGVNKQSTIADIGAGTGILTHMLGSLECSVLAIEPNEQMLYECRKHCKDINNIQFIKAPAEETSLKENSVDVITIAQAFHWFDKNLCKKEFQRILKDDGYVLILWNEMQTDSQFAQEYTTALHKYKVKTTAAISNFDPDEEKLNFFGQDYTKVYYDNWQTVTEEGFVGGALSLSYTPSKLDSMYVEFVAELHQLFSKYQQNERVTFHYKTEVCICKFSE
ncbi:class I SAM-dependent methyltransferase [Rossellomorea vietnamensis]|uniref:Class I SAM-dependent methyltransferase n=1 Tax=Rossellomorea vietnamensis TaxID=218284 RepID=A0A5D4K8Y5_9BACI|nr:class I SAM-dependent methyltransferase [Rossellomorea vietnamensis]TYR73738.1 class I SAM-dependent methyltransferase [Rossellomorea vietnamensis]